MSVVLQKICVFRDFITLNLVLSEELGVGEVRVR